jgi:hypothetical protein
MPFAPPDGMALVRPVIVAPDTSHWANWIDDALGPDASKRDEARRLHARMLERGRIPLISWHHLEELLCIESDGNARSRVAFLQSLPMVAWMRMPGANEGLGGIMEIMAGEALAFHSGCEDLIDVRDWVRTRLMRTGTVTQAIGRENWVWDVARPEMMARRPRMGMVSALSDLRPFDDAQTVGQLSRKVVRSPADRRAMLSKMHADATAQALPADQKRGADEARAMADGFLASMIEMEPPTGTSVRDLIVATHVAQGLDPEEIRDDCTIAELALLGTFRSQLRITARLANVPFERLKGVRMESLPSWRIGEALQRHGQKRTVRPGSDLHDQHLAVLAAYVDELFVDSVRSWSA